MESKILYDTNELTYKTETDLQTHAATQPEEGLIIKCSHPSGIKVWVTPPGKPPGPAYIRAEGKGDVEWVGEGGKGRR